MCGAAKGENEDDELSNMASWSALPTDLGNTILRRLQHHADRVRFGTVCREWRACARRNTPPSQFPWLALPDRTFYSLPDSAFQPLPLHLERHRQLPHAQSSCGEWFVFERRDGAYTLVNTFSMSTTMVLPRLPTEPSHAIGDPPPFMKKLVVCSPKLVAAVVGEGWQLALCRPGSASWVVVAHDQLKSLQDMIWHRGKLYALHDTRCRLLCVSVGEDRDTGEPNVSRVDILVEGSMWEVIESPPWSPYLLESDGALLMVRRGDPNSDIQNPFMGGDSVHYVGRGLERATRFTVFKADLARSRWTELSSVGEDTVLFVQGWCSRAVRIPGRCKDYVTGDRIFFVSDAAARGYHCPYYRKKVSFYCSFYDMRKRRSQTYLGTKVRPLKGFPVAWLFRGSSERACINK
ncbi:uncharacterized protein [Lolium perenne]|uniref:uncharacterized protein n=1 Tax=Lolium perenne TaxID=4522 RepID=UPI003A99D466